MGCRGPVDGNARGEIGLRDRHFDLADAPAQAAALVGAEGNDLLAGSIPDEETKIPHMETYSAHHN